MTTVQQEQPATASASRWAEPSPLPPALRLFVPLPRSPEGCVQPGTRVKRGDVLAKSSDPTSAFALAPVAGTIVRLSEVERLGQTGRSPALEIEVDPAEKFEPMPDRLDSAASAPEQGGPA